MMNDWRNTTLPSGAYLLRLLAGLALLLHNGLVRFESAYPNRLSICSIEGGGAAAAFFYLLELISITVHCVIL